MINHIRHAVANCFPVTWELNLRETRRRRQPEIDRMRFTAYARCSKVRQCDGGDARNLRFERRRCDRWNRYTYTHSIHETRRDLQRWSRATTWRRWGSTQKSVTAWNVSRWKTSACSAMSTLLSRRGIGFASRTITLFRRSTEGATWYNGLWTDRISWSWIVNSRPEAPVSRDRIGKNAASLRRMSQAWSRLIMKMLTIVTRSPKGPR